LTTSTLPRWLKPLLLVVLLPLAAVALGVYLAYGVLVHLLIWAAWLPRGRSVLVVYSNSPHWQARFEEEVLPRLGRRAVVLNWSERARWGRAPLLARAAFAFFGGRREFNPLVVVFRLGRPARVFRFWRAYQAAKHGDPAPLEALEADLFALAGAGP
jgi:hypothetical protein